MGKEVLKCSKHVRWLTGVRLLVVEREITPGHVDTPQYISLENLLMGLDWSAVRVVPR